MNDKRKIEKLWYFDTEEDFSGRALELKRKVDLAYYNDYETIAKSPDWVDWTDSEDLEFDFLAKRVLKTYADRFILQASEYGISRYEKMLGIEPEREESLNERRKRVYLLWNRKIKWTHRTLVSWLNEWFGKKNYTLELAYNEYGINFQLFVKSGIVDEASILRNLRMIVPANLWIKISYAFSAEVQIVSQYGTYNYVSFLCGEHPCGDIPYTYAEAQRVSSDLKVQVGVNISKNYYPTVNKIKSGDVEGEITGIIYQSNLDDDRVFSFEGGKDVK